MGFSFRSSRLASVGLASIVAIGVIGIGSVAMADEPATGSDTPAQGAERDHHPVAKGVHSILDNSGVTAEELKEGAQAGLTLGQIIDQYGDISADQAKANALAKLSDKLDQAVADGKVTQEQADKVEANAPALLDKVLAAVPGEHRGELPHHGLFLKIGKEAIATVSDVLGIEPRAILEDLRSGQTIADIAGDQTQAVIDALTDKSDAAIDKLVADGKIPADKADSAKSRAADAIEKLVNEGRPNKPGNGERHPVRAH
ncbi:MAG: hypothetical protein WBO97_11585 [Tepidiformaceae bacterium]